MSPTARQLLLVLSCLGAADVARAARCELLPPLSEATGADMGFLFIPGANYPGERYKPLGEAIQAALPGARLWIGLTEGWLIDTPNPLEIAAAIEDCKNQAQELGLGGTLFISGHSLGGIMLEQYLQTNIDAVDGIVLFGSYLTNFLMDTDNQFGVPALTLVGTLDGLTLSYVYREWVESHEAEAKPGMEGRFPVHAVDRVNHAQIGSGEVPSFVLERDIPAEISDDEAHFRVAEAVASFLVLQNSQQFNPQEVEAALNTKELLDTFTQEFLEPFRVTALLETDGKTSEWTARGQRILVSDTEDELQQLEVTNYVVEFGDLGDVKPGIDFTDDCSAEVTTYAHPEYDLDLFDAAGLLSAKVIKAKYKLEDSVWVNLCLPQAQRRQCRHINEAALAAALELATEEARERYFKIGTQLIFLDDSVSPWGPGWEFSSGLHYNNVNKTHTTLYSTSLISEPDFIIASAAGMHYCDLLSPYRALEWIYITSVVGKA